jgi:hypothetical protein
MDILDWWETDGSTSSIDDSGTRRYKRCFRCLTDSDLVDGAFIRASILCPQIYDFYFSAAGSDFGARCVKVDCTRLADDPKTWDITAEYSSRWSLDLAKGENPCDWPPEFKIRCDKFEEGMTEDIDGNAIINTIGEAFDPPLKRNRIRFKLCVTKNLPSVDMLKLSLVVETVNLYSFYGFEPETVLLWDVTADEVTRDQYSYWAHTFEFLVDSEGWDEKVVNIGTRMRQEIGGEIVAARTADGQRIKSVYLDEDGVKMNPLVPGFKPHLITFKKYQTSNFAILGIGG